MRRLLGLAWKELSAQKVTSVLILAAVVLSSAMTAMAGQSIGILNTMRAEQAAGLNGRRHVTFHNVTWEQREALFTDHRVAYAGSSVALGTADLGESTLSVILREYGGDDLQRVYPESGRVQAGRLPEKAGELALPEDALRLLDFQGSVGDTVTLHLRISLLHDTQPSYEFTHTFILCGILESNYLGYSSGTTQGAVGQGTAAALLPERYQVYSVDLLLRDLSGFQNQVDALAADTGADPENIQYNWVYLSALGVPYDGMTADTGDGFPFLMAAAVLIGGLVLLAAGLVIYNILKIAVTRRIRQYGVLRAIGASLWQVHALVALQALLLCALGLPGGLLLGCAAAKGVLRAALSFLSPQALNASSVGEVARRLEEAGSGGAGPLLFSAVITVAFALLAAMPAARYAARVSPTAAMASAGTRVKRRRRHMGRIHSFPAFYARLSLLRSPGRTAVTILSLVMSIAVFVALQSFSGLLDASRQVQALNPGDYALTNTSAGFPPEAAEALAGAAEVESLERVRLSVYTQDAAGNLPVELSLTMAPAESFQLASLSPGRLETWARGLDRQVLDRVLAGEGVLVKNPIAFQVEGTQVPHTQLAAGDVVRVNGVPLTVAAVVDGAVTVGDGAFVNGVQLILSEAGYTALTGRDRIAELYLTVAEETDRTAFEEKLDDFCRRWGGTWLSYEETDRQLEESFEQLRLLCWGLILLIGLIGLLNIVNTVYTNLHTRVAEIGMQRAVGMSRMDLCRTFLWEGVYYGLIASVIGGAAGTVCTAFVNGAAGGAFSFSIPVAAILEASAVSIIACLLATAIPLRSISNMDIVEAIGAAE